jgi:hypothetical protein
MTKKTYIHPVRKTACNKVALEVGLRDAESDYLTKNSTMGKVAAIAVIAAYKKALGLPMSELKYQGRKIDLSTVTLDDKGNPSFQMPQPERDHWTEINADTEYAHLEYNGHSKVRLDRLVGRTDDNPSLTDKEWQQWIDLMSAAPNLIQLARDVKAFLTPDRIENFPKGSQEIACSILNLAEHCIDKSNECTKNWKE